MNAYLVTRFITGTLLWYKTNSKLKNVHQILVVDDSPGDLHILEKLLTTAGYQIITATDGSTAIALYGERKPDLVLLDMVMPEMDGIATLRAIKEIDPVSRVIMCTASGIEPVVRLAMLSGASGFVTKPYEEDTILRTIRNILEEEG